MRNGFWLWCCWEIVLLAVAEAGIKWRREMNEFCARLPVDPHCPLLHTMTDIFASYNNAANLLTKKEDEIKFALESFCEPATSAITIESLGEMGGYVRLEKHNFCRKHKEENDWLERFFLLFLSDIKYSSVTGHYATDTANYLKEFLELAFARQERGLDLKFRLNRADWFLTEVQQVVATGSIRKIEEEGGWLNIIISICLSFLFLFIFFAFLAPRLYPSQT